MDFTEHTSLDISLRVFIRNLLLKLYQEEERQQKKALIFQFFLSSGCDFYELLNLYSDFPMTEFDGKMITENAPSPLQIYPISPNNIRLSLPHWTPSKYHTAPITEVINDIQQCLVSHKPVIKVFNSNLNPQKKQLYNDRYILVITSHKSLLLDINRRTTIQFRDS